MEIHRVVGPPGCGKTTYVARQCQRAVERWGEEGALVVSLTKAAAVEAAGRRTGLASHMVGTLHAHAFRALGRPEIVERKHLEDWNVRHPNLQIGAAAADEDEFGRPMGGQVGDELLQEAELLRAQCVPVELWPARIGSFHEHWTAFKHDLGVSDFTDLIEQAADRVLYPPHRPSVIFADEAQDLSRLELRLLERWMPHVEHVALVGDADQALYHWRGADPDVLRGEIFSTLAQSYRVPRAVHAAAVQVIERSTARQPVEYHPTADAGDVRRAPVTWRDPDALVPLLEEVERRGETVMLLASCAFFLDPVCKVLRERGVPYGNPYTPARWNPLGVRNGTSTPDRLRAFVRAETLADFKLFVPLLRTDGEGAAVVRGGKKRIEELPDDAPVELVAQAIRGSFTPGGLSMLRRQTPDDTARSLELLTDAVVPSKQQAVRYPLTIARSRGVAALEAPPKVIIGSIHSVKGGEAHTVVVIPDLSPAAFRQYSQAGWAQRDAIWRLFYVAFTRAQHELVITAPGGRLYAEL